MELWFTEEHTENVRFSMKVDKQIYSGKSEFQRIDIFESVEFGRVMALDGYLMRTEKDEFIYHEMITHVPMCVHPNAKKVFVIGGGDGGFTKEQFAKMSMADKSKLYRENKAEYDRLLNS